VNELALFAGAGGGILGGHLLGWRTVCAVEWSAYPASVLIARQNDGILPPFPVWDDVQTFDGRPWRGLVDVVSGGFPCQDISVAGSGAGIEGERSGMWKHMARIVGEVRPRFVFVENSPLLVGRGLAVVLGDLADLGYDAQWFRLSASDCGAPHQRDRCWLVANSERACDRREIVSGETARQEADRPASRACRPSYRHGESNVADATGQRCGISRRDQVLAERESRAGTEHSGSTGFPYPGIQRLQERQGLRPRRQTADATAPTHIGWPSEPDVGRVVNGMAARVDRLKALGNGQVPRVAAAAFSMLHEK